MPYLSTLLLSTFITIALIPVFSRGALRFNIGLDLPDARKVHERPIPRVGGIAITLGVYGSTIFWSPQDQFLKAYAIAGGFIVLFGLLDDLKGIDFRLKFFSQMVAALVIVIYGGIKIKSLGGLLPDDMLLPDAIAIPLTVVAIVGVTNAVNLADGLDGLAGGICLLSFSCLAYLAYLEENFALCLLGLALAGSIFGFLRYNTYPAELFMGDTGSQFLGFSAVSLSLSLTQGQTPLSPLLPLMILGFPGARHARGHGAEDFRGAASLFTGQEPFPPQADRPRALSFGVRARHLCSPGPAYYRGLFFQIHLGMASPAGYLLLSAHDPSGFPCCGKEPMETASASIFRRSYQGPAGRTARARHSHQGLLSHRSIRRPSSPVRDVPGPFQDPPCRCSSLWRLPGDSPDNIEV